MGLHSRRARARAVDGHFIHRPDQIAPAENRVATDRNRPGVADRSAAVTADGRQFAIDVQAILASRRPRPNDMVPTAIAQPRRANRASRRSPVGHPIPRSLVQDLRHAHCRR